MTSLAVKKLTASVGAEVTGLDSGRMGVDDALAAAVLDALEEYGVLVFHDLWLSPPDQVAFCSRFGEVDRSADGHHPVSGIYPITLDKSRNSAADYLRAAFFWHIDGCTPLHNECPQKATILSARQVAAQGGETEFVSAYAAYDALSDEEKERFGSMRVIHSLEASQQRVTPDPSSDELARWRSRPPHEHPLVWTHRSGRKSLVLGASADHVVGMDYDEGRALLQELLGRATTAENIYSHRWSMGDTVIWDNRGVLHRAAPYDQASDREMLRTTVLGDEPIE